MIIIKDRSKANRIFISKNTSTDINLEFEMKLISLSTNNEYNFDVLDEFPQPNFYVFTIDLSNLELGEYKALVISKEYPNKCLSTTLLRIGESPTIKDYTQNDKIKFYE